MHMAAKVIGGLAGLTVIAWSGTRVRPPPFESPTWHSRDAGSMELAADLPAPVARYATTVFGGSIPVVESALILGRADLTLNGIAVKGRFTFYHQAGSAYRHEIQLTWFGLPLVTVVEQFKDGQAVMSLPGTRIENDEKTNRAANQGLWAEALWLPSIWFTDRRVEWVAIDDAAARLVIPDAADEEQLTTTFDADTGLIQDLTTLRYGQSDDPARRRWTNTAIEWGAMNGIRIPVVISTRWGDDKPWARWSVDDVIYNLDVSRRFATFGKGDVDQRPM
jgi:hypothetical protein